MLTIFSTAKPFDGQSAIIQTNAIHSWTMLHPACEVILFGNAEGTAEIATRLGIRHIPDVESNEYGTPLVSSMFSIAQDVANYQLLCYVNADIILMSDFLPAINQVQKDRFLLVGQRWDVDFKNPVAFDDPAWEAGLRAYIEREATLHSPAGIDYFVFPRGLYRDIPRFVIGRIGWDNWMIYHARSRGVPVIDATEVVTAIHQNHDYSHLPGGKMGLRKGPESDQNRYLLGGPDHAFTVLDATWVLGRNGIKKKSKARLLSQTARRLQNRSIRLMVGLRRRLCGDA